MHGNGAPRETRLGRYPAASFGSGPPLVFLAGLSPESGAPSAAMRSTLLAGVAPFVRDRTVHYLNRRRGLPRGMTMAALAADHAEALRAGFDGPVDVMGVSTGGSIAQQLAADHPDVVRRLVLGGAACRLEGEAKELQRRVAARVRAGAHRQALALLAADLVPPRRGQVMAGLAAAVAGPRLFRDRQGLEDMATTIEAEDGFDLTRCARPIAAPTLIIGGARDRFYSRAVFEETAALIPGSRLILLSGRGHVTAMADRRYAPAVLAFLGAGAARAA